MGFITDVFHYLRIFRKYIGRRLYIVFALTMAAALAEGFGIALLLPLLQVSEMGPEAAHSRLEQGLVGLVQWMGIGESMLGILMFIAIMFIAKGVLKFGSGAYSGYLQSRLLRQLKGDMFDRYGTMDYRYYIKNNTGHFINVINGQVNGFYRSFTSFMVFLSTVIATFSYLAIAFAIAWQFALMAVGLGLTLLFLFQFLNAYVRTLSRKASKENSQLNKLLVQSLHAFKYIVSTGQIGQLRGAVTASIKRYTHYRFRQKVAGAFTGAVKEPVSALFIIFVVSIQVAVFNAPVAPILVALLLFHRGMQSVISVQGGWQKTMDSIGSLEMVDDEFKALLLNRERGGIKPIGPLSGGIEFRGVSFAYNVEEGYVLEDVSLTIPSYTTVAFVGESGAGKSTLVDLLTLLLRPQTGTVLIDGVPGSEVELHSWRSQIGYVAQETVVFDDTVANNICLWSGDYREDHAVRERVETAAQRAYVHHFIKELPEGYETVVGDRGVRLSGGQRQRLFIARELYKNPNLLILDEATSALDSASEHYIQQSIDALKGRMTVVIIAHRLSTIRNVDYLYVLKGGRIVEEGSFVDLTSQESSRFREMVELQSL